MSNADAPTDRRLSSSPPLTAADLVAAARALRSAEYRALFGDLHGALSPYWLAAWKDVDVDRGRVVALTVGAA